MNNIVKDTEMNGPMGDFAVRRRLPKDFFVCRSACTTAPPVNVDTTALMIAATAATTTGSQHPTPRNGMEVEAAMTYSRPSLMPDPGTVPSSQHMIDARTTDSV